MSRRRALLLLVLATLVLGGLTAVWTLTPARDLVSLARIEELAAPYVNSPFLPAYILGAFLVAAALFISVWLVIFETGVLMAPPWGTLLAFTGAMMSASLAWWLGRSFLRAAVLRVVSPRIQGAVRGAGIPGVIAVRVLPLAPFTLVNMAAGALDVRYRDYAIGTAIGMGPGIVAVTLLGDRVIALVKDPSVGAVVAVGGVVALAVCMGLVMRRLARRHAAQTASPPPDASA